MVKVSELVQRKLIPYRSNIGVRGSFERLNIFEIFQDSYRDLTIDKVPQKHIFAFLLIHSVNPTAEKSSETDSK